MYIHLIQKLREAYELEKKRTGYYNDKESIDFTKVLSDKSITDSNVLTKKTENLKKKHEKEINKVDIK